MQSAFPPYALGSGLAGTPYTASLVNFAHSFAAGELVGAEHRNDDAFLINAKPEAARRVGAGNSGFDFTHYVSQRSHSVEPESGL